MFIKKCPEGYVDEGELCSIIDKKIATKIEIPYCIVGTLINGKCYDVGSNLSIKPNVSYFGIYYCDYGYNLIGNDCVPISRNPMYKEKIICPEGYYNNPSGLSGADIPQIELPGVPVYCYKKIYVEKK